MRYKIDIELRDHAIFLEVSKRRKIVFNTYIFLRSQPLFVSTRNEKHLVLLIKLLQLNGL
jgi:hypothetical protein